MSKLYLTFDPDNETFNLINEAGECTHYSKYIKELTDWIKSLGYVPDDSPLVYKKSGNSTVC